MFYDLFRFVRGVWDGILLPYVILSIANLATDGWEAVTHLRDTIVVLSCFLWGCSHKRFPLSRSAVEAQRAALAGSPRAAGGGGGGASSSSSPSLTTTSSASLQAATAVSAAAALSQGRGGYQRGSEDENDADSEADFSGQQRSRAAAKNAATSDGADGGLAGGDGKGGSSSSSKGNTCPLIQRRLLLGKKGEVEEWLPAVNGCLLVPPQHTLRLSRSLHQLVSIVIGPIQQPTVSTMPTRHPEPQWPPHFTRTFSGHSSTGSHGAAASGANAAGGGGAAGGVDGGRLGDPSTDEYSSSNSSAAPKTLRHRLSGGGSNNSGVNTRYRQASSVVYQRVSSRNLDFSSSRVAPHLIASITAHHVLSYPATRQKVLVMDLDETLCYVSTSTANMAGPPTFSEVIPTASGAELFHVWERPYARLFLSTAAKLFNLVLFTSASRPYADTILQRIDPDHLLKLRFYRQDCRVVPRGLLRKMCAVASMRGGVANNSAGSGSGGGGGGAGLMGSDREGRNVFSNAGPLGDLTSATANSDEEGGVNTSAAAAAASGGVGQSQRNLTTSNTTRMMGGDGYGRAGGLNRSNWEDGASTDGRDVPSSGGESSATTAYGAAVSAAMPYGGASTPRAEEERTRGGSNAAPAAAFVPTWEKQYVNEHAKVLVKDLRVLKVPPELLVMIDNSEECTLVNPENALIVSPYIPSLTKATQGEKAAPPVQPACDAPQQNGNYPGSSEWTAAADGAATPLPQTAALPTGSNATASAAASLSPQQQQQQGDGTDSVAGKGGAGDAGILMGDDPTVSEAQEEDEVLLSLLPMLECLLVVPDVRSILRLGKMY